MKKFILPFAFTLLILSGCHTSKQVTRALDTWIGSKKSELIAIHGAPSQTYTQDEGNYIIVFFVKKCKIQFFVDQNDIITRSTWDGCYKASTINNWSKYR